MNQDAMELLAFITREREAISRNMHEEKRRDSVLQRAATLLRTGENVRVVEAMLDAKEILL
jgi:hypothetical protein